MHGDGQARHDRDSAGPASAAATDAGSHVVRRPWALAIQRMVPSACWPATRSSRGPGAASSTGISAVDEAGGAACTRKSSPVMLTCSPPQQEWRNDPDVLLGVPPRRVVGHAEHALDDRLVRRADAEREPARHADGRRDGGRPGGLEDGMAGVGLQYGGAELDARGGPTGERIATSGSPATASRTRGW